MECLIKLKDNQAVKFIEDKSFKIEGGCPTCDMGSEYITEIKFVCTSCIITVGASTDCCDYGVSYSDMIQLLSNTDEKEMRLLNEREFACWLKKNIKGKFNCEEISISVTEKI